MKFEWMQSSLMQFKWYKLKFKVKSIFHWCLDYDEWFVIFNSYSHNNQKSFMITLHWIEASFSDISYHVLSKTCWDLAKIIELWSFNKKCTYVKRTLKEKFFTKVLAKFSCSQRIMNHYIIDHKVNEYGLESFKCCI